MMLRIATLLLLSSLVSGDTLLQKPRAVWGVISQKICVAGADIWFNQMLYPRAGNGGHMAWSGNQPATPYKREHNPGSWTNALAGGEQTLDQILPQLGGKYLMFHGTQDTSLQYMLGAAGKVDFEYSHINQLSRGFYLTASPNEAKTYACQNKANNNGRAAVMVFEITNAAALRGYTKSGTGVSRIKKNYDANSNDFKSYDTTKASFVRLKNKPNQFAFKSAFSSDGTHPTLQAKLLSVVLLGNNYVKLKNSNENKRSRATTPLTRCTANGLHDLSGSPSSSHPAYVKNDYTYESLHLDNLGNGPIPACTIGASWSDGIDFTFCASKTANDCGAEPAKLPVDEHACGDDDDELCGDDPQDGSAALLLAQHRRKGQH